MSAPASGSAGAPAGPRLAATLRRLHGEGRAGLSVYLTSGFPDAASHALLAGAAVAGGADWIEVGIPFSDPVADGPILQAANASALAAGATVGAALAALRTLRARHPDVPVVAMTYANVVHRRGWTAFARDLAAAGGDGLIVPDVPIGESGPLRAALAAHGLAHVPLLAPTTPPQRMAAIAATATGFVYVVANVGVTGQTQAGGLIEATLAAARKAAPHATLVAGFGIRTPEDVRRIRAAGADAVIVGSHLAAMVQQGAGPEQVRDEVARLRRAC